MSIEQKAREIVASILRQVNFQQRAKETEEGRWDETTPVIVARLGIIEGVKMALKAAEDEKWAEHHVDACERNGNLMPYVYNSACHDISKAIRALIEEQKV